LLSCASFLLDFWSINHSIPGRSNSFSIVKDCCLLGGTVSLFCLVVAIFSSLIILNHLANCQWFIITLVIWNYSFDHSGKLSVLDVEFCGGLFLIATSFLWQIAG